MFTVNINTSKKRYKKVYEENLNDKNVHVKTVIQE